MLTTFLVSSFMLAAAPDFSNAACANDNTAALTQGHDPAAFVEVEPGVFLLEEALKTGVDFTREEPAYDKQDTARAPADRLAPAPVFCYNSQCDNQFDQTSNGTLFGGNPSWSGNVCTNSYLYNSGSIFYSYNWVSFSAHTQTPVAVPTNYTYATLHVNGAYVGYLYDYQNYSNYSQIYGYLYAGCVNGVLSAEVQHYHYANAGFETLYIGDRVATKVKCCI